MDVSCNTQYGLSALVNQKYSPLTITRFDKSRDSDLITELRKAYDEVYQDQFGYGENCILVQDIDDPHPDTTTGTPFIVISSGRAKTVRALLENAEQDAHPGSHLALNGAHGWYSPRRTGRHLFVLVHALEYECYERTLRDLQGHGNPPSDTTGAHPHRVYVVGYSFPYVPVGGSMQTVVGFGACRRAALILARALQCNAAWIVDDNVVHVNGLPLIFQNELTSLEAAFNATAAICCGFTGATEALPRWERTNAGTFNFTLAPPGQPTPALVQQAVYWKIKRMDLGVSGYFVNSNEDVSLVNQYQASGPVSGKQRGSASIALYSAYAVKKCTPTPDTPDANPGAMQLATLRATLTSAILTRCGSISAPKSFTGTLRDLLNTTLAPLGARLTNTARCQALEQILARAAEIGLLTDDMFTYPGFVPETRRAANKSSSSAKK